MTCFLATAAAGLLAAQTTTATVAPPAEHDGYSYHPSTGEPPPRVKTERAKRKEVVVMTRSLLSTGMGKNRLHCEGDRCLELPEPVAYTEKPAFGFELALLSQASRHLRIGAGFGVIPKMTLNKEGEDFELGSLFPLDALIEGLIDLNNELILSVHGRAGITVLLPTGDMAESDERNYQACEDYPNGECEADTGVFFGAQAGLGVGLIWKLGSIGLRADLDASVYSLTTLGVEVGDTEASSRFVGVRPTLMFGVEF